MGDFRQFVCFYVGMQGDFFCGDGGIYLFDVVVKDVVVDQYVGCIDFVWNVRYGVFFFGE